MTTFLYILLLAIVLPAPFLFFLYIYITVEKKAKGIIELLPDDAKAKYTDVRIWFKGYDMMKRINRYQIDPLKSLYTYNLADVIVFNGGIVVIGKIKVFGRVRLLSPFAICRPGAGARLQMVRDRVTYLGAEVVEQDVEIKFHDQDYTNNITLVIKKAGGELYSDINSNFIS
ncbi:hypothetical protein [Puia sp.]|jgi:hypothetical protein|uniref:hypothetical protein n=1 Tax=Puia sp. TaxID=2045100 RepID=UPI002F3F4E42